MASVLVYHAGIVNTRVHWRGGWLGVDLFFVLSGFLITRLLLAEFTRSGRIRLGRFYLRRVLRLYPMILLVLAASVVIHELVPGRAALRTSRGALVSIAGYFVNWHVLRERSTRSLGLWTHLWTLSIEEQFYVVWPLVLVGLLLAGGRRRILLAVTVGLTVAIAVYRWRVARVAYPGGQVNVFMIIPRMRLWYYGSFTHTDGLMAGAALAVWTVYAGVPRLLTRRLLAALTPCALLTMAVITYQAGQHSTASWIPYWGIAAFNLCSVVVIVYLLAVPHAAMGRVLAWRPLVWVGRRSYGIYVFNLPIYTLLREFTSHDGDVVVALGTVLTLVAAGISYRWYEAPFLRLKDRFGHVAGSR